MSPEEKNAQSTDSAAWSEERMGLGRRGWYNMLFLKPYSMKMGEKGRKEWKIGGKRETAIITNFPKAENIKF